MSKNAPVGTLLMGTGNVRQSAIGAACARQAAKIRELEKVLLTLGYKSAGQRAAVLGLKRSTVWAIFNAEHTRGGLSSNTVKQLLAAKAAPNELRQVVAEYVREKLAGAYGHEHSVLKRFHIRAGLPSDAN